MAKVGPLFAAAGAPPGKALVYVYWPHGEQGRFDRAAVLSCEEGGIEEIRRGAYTAFAVEPGRSCFRVERHWDVQSVGHVGAFASQDLADMELNVEAGGTYFVRLQQEPRLLVSRVALRQVEPGVASPEIRRCRRLIPLSPEELARRFMRDER
ncbi:MAG TPA: hypothetical protein VGG03_27085 [Thermoanaerobaculia bacterium]